MSDQEPVRKSARQLRSIKRTEQVEHQAAGKKSKQTAAWQQKKKKHARNRMSSGKREKKLHRGEDKPSNLTHNSMSINVKSVTGGTREEQMVKSNE